jgi:AbrB family looped-hinge helix DNA binding protein
MSTATLSSKFQIGIPKDVRERLHLEAGQKISFVEKSGLVHLLPVPTLDALKGLARGAKTTDYRDRSDRNERLTPLSH